MRENASRHPARTDHTVRLQNQRYQIGKRAWRGCAIGIDIADEIGSRRKCESFDERATFADWVREIQRADERKLGGHFLHDTQRIIAAPIKHNDQLEFALILVAKVSSVFAQHRL